jgi:hypothetical protein
MKTLAIMLLNTTQLDENMQFKIETTSFCPHGDNFTNIFALKGFTSEICDALMEKKHSAKMHPNMVLSAKAVA